MEYSDWWKKSVVYQIYPKSFQDTNGDGIGDLQGIIEHLDYLEKLGVDVLWLNPVYKSPQVDNGYDIADYREIDPIFGTMEDFDQLLESAHEHHLKIVMDLVVNHTSSKHPWFKEAKKSRENKYHDYFIWRESKNNQEPNNWGASFGGSAWEYVDEVAQYYLHLFAKEQPDLNWENPKVRFEVYDLMKYWLNKGIDGFRMDVINLISKSSYDDVTPKPGQKYSDYRPRVANGPKAHEYLHEMNQEVLSKYDIMTVGEMPSTSPAEASKYTNPKNEELNMIFEFEHMGIDRDPVYGKYTDKRFKLIDLKKVLSKWQMELADKGGWNSLYWSNHDQPRAVSRFGSEKYRVESAKMLGTLLHFMQGTPYIFEGEEIGMTNVHFPSISDYDDIDTLNAYKVLRETHGLSNEEAMKGIYAQSRDNARTPMPWNSQTNGGFTGGKPWLQLNPNYNEINVQNTLADPNSIFYYYQKLIQLRHDLAIITTGNYTLLDPDNPDLFIYTREQDSEGLLVVCNFSEKEINYEIPPEYKNGSILIGNYSDSAMGHLKPYEAIVIKK
ncbi:glycoside hydrolase family 13 protein [Xylocopilactobacillus apis]|uniref:Glucohydrolase n=1 Tax=Xylocopilactobacillus apis TaxID=2932183 RepID=A0AAU9CZF7_9LACO|nr:alpha-glucosidase [Xylocopilactobacillus apis]BDR56784.1 glucohydrolase [Xylocopilactobacillus apis]